MADVTKILSSIDSGNLAAAEQLLPLVYDELRRLAAARMSKESPDHTLEATALVHEAYLRLVNKEDHRAWDSRGHFFAAAAEAMRRILVDRARAKRRPKHGGALQKADFEINCPASLETPDRLVAIDEALNTLDSDHADVAQLLKLRYFAGMPLKDAAHLLGISPATAKRRWAFARAFLYNALKD